MNALVPRRPWTEAERLLARALARCRFPCASFQKRFARDMRTLEASGAGITERQAAQLRRQVSIHRRQVKASELAEESRYLLTEETARRLREGAISPVPPRPAPEPKPERLYPTLRMVRSAPVPSAQLGFPGVA